MSNPHLTGGFSPRQEAQFDAEPFMWVDSRGLHALLKQQGLEVLIVGDSELNGKIVLARLDGYYVEAENKADLTLEWADGSLVAYRKVTTYIASVTIPIGVSKMAYVLKMYSPRDGNGPRKMYVY